MNRARTPPTTAQSLMRWLAAWLALALCAQAFAVGSAALRGVGHRHSSLDLESKPMLLWRHAGERADTRETHAHAHADGEVHLHAADDSSVLGSDAHAAALAAFVSAPSSNVATLTSPPCDLRHAWVAAGQWSPTARAVAPALHPPRA